MILLLSMLLIGILVGNKYLWPVYKEKTRQRKISEQIPEALLLTRGSNSINELVHEIARVENELGKEFKAVEHSMRALPIEKALDNLSKPLEQVVIALKTCAQTGVQLDKVLEPVYEQAARNQSLLRERQSSLAIEKQTLLLAGGVLVPMILGIIVSIVTNLGFQDLHGLGLGMSLQDKIALSSAAVLGSQIYIVEYALMASFFIALLEERIEKTLLYSVVLVPLSLSLFILTKTVV